VFAASRKEEKSRKTSGTRVIRNGFQGSSTDLLKGIYRVIKLESGISQLLDDSTLGLDISCLLYKGAYGFAQKLYRVVQTIG